MDIDVPDGATAVAVLLHPHPDMGGDRHNHVVSALFRRLPERGIGTIRFDFTSDMVQATAATTSAIDAAAGAGVPIALVGYSFGSMVAVQVADERVAGWFLVALPVDHVDASAVAADPRPKALAVPEHDFAPPERVAEVTADWTSTERHVVAEADHFIGPHTGAVVDLVTDWIRSLP